MQKEIGLQDKKKKNHTVVAKLKLKAFLNMCVWYYSFRFPGGIQKLARYLHDRGLKLGIYGDMGKLTCGGYPGTPLDKIELDAQTFADWEVDMFKYDGCYSNATEQEQGKNTRLNLFCVDIKILLIGTSF